MSHEIELTKAQEAVVVWLWNHQRTRFTGGTLVELYEGRWAEEEKRYYEEQRALGRDVILDLRPGTPRTHGWRRTGGRVLAALAKKGVLEDIGFEGLARGTSYVFTEVGKDIAFELIAKASR